MSSPDRLPLSLAIALGLTIAPVAAINAQDAEEAYRMRASIYAEGALVTAASWVAVKNRTSTITQTFGTPYQRDVALAATSADVEGVLEGEVTMSVRPFDHQGEMCLEVDINTHTVEQLYHYHSDDLLEILPGSTGFAVGGPFCDSEEVAEGLLFNLSHDDDTNYAEILVTREVPVKRDD